MASSGLSASTVGFLAGLNPIVQQAQNTTSSKVTGGGGSSAGKSAGGFLSTLGSIGSGVLDILSRPLYAVASGVQQAEKEHFGVGDPNTGIFGQIGQGFMGRNKEDFGQLIQENADLNAQREINKLQGQGDTAKGWQPGQGYVNPWLKLTGGLGADIFLDPSTYVGAGAVKEIIKAPIQAVKTFKDANLATKVAIDAGAANIPDAAHTINEVAKTEQLLPNAVPSPLTKADYAKQILTDHPAGPLNPSRGLPPELITPSMHLAHPVEFADGISKALYDLANTGLKGSKAAKLITFLSTHFPGEKDIELLARGKQVKDIIAKTGKMLPATEPIKMGYPMLPALSNASRAVVKGVKDVTAGKATHAAIEALEAPAQKVQAGIDALNAAAGDEHLHDVVSGVVADATKDAILPEIAPSAGTLHADTLINKVTAKGNLAHPAVLGEIAKAEGIPVEKYWKSGQSVINRGIFKLFNPSAGQQTIHNLSRTAVEGMLNAITLKNRVLWNQLNRIPLEARQAAWLAIKHGLVADIKDPQVAQAAKIIETELAKILGLEGMAEKARAGTTAVAQSGMTSKMMNTYLKISGGHKFANFTDGIVDGKDYGKGNWIHSWKSVIPDNTDPLEFLTMLNSATTKATAERWFYGSLGLLPGVVKSDKPFIAGKVLVEHPDGFTQGLHFPPEAAREVENLISHVQDFKVYGPQAQKMLDYFDRSQNTWKRIVTQYNPQHHVHNFIGDAFLSFINGMTSPVYYSKALKVGMAQRKLIHGFDNVAPDLSKITFEDLVNMGGYGKAIEGSADPSHIVSSIRIAGHSGKTSIDSNQYSVALNQLGALPHFNVVEDFPGSISAKTPFFTGPFGGRVNIGLQHFSEGREHLERMAYFIYRVEHPPKGIKAYKSLAEAFETAARDTRRVHPAGQDLTRFESEVMRRVMPFYSWSRKSIPVLLSALMERPGRVTSYFKLQHNLALSQGVNQPSISDQFPTDQAFPQWLREEILGPVIGQPGSYTSVNPGVPGTTELADLGKPLNYAGGLLSPLLKVPLSLAAHSDIGSGAAISSPGTYINQNTPITSLLDRLTGYNVGPGSLAGAPLQTPTQQKAPDNDLTGLVNWLTGLGLLNQGKYIPGSKAKATAP